MLPERLSSATVRVARAATHRWRRSIRLAEPAWDALSRELDIWQARTLRARFWWILPVLVPPYNFLARSLCGIVADEGFRFVSVEGDFTGLPIVCRNVHIDPIDWRRTAANGPGTLVRQALSALGLRRFGLLSPASPIGIVAHHLKHDADIWQSTVRLLSCLTAHPAAAFPPLTEIFAS